MLLKEVPPLRFTHPYQPLTVLGSLSGSCVPQATMAACLSRELRALALLPTLVHTVLLVHTVPPGPGHRRLLAGHAGAGVEGAGSSCPCSLATAGSSSFWLLRGVRVSSRRATMATTSHSTTTANTPATSMGLSNPALHWER